MQVWARNPDRVRQGILTPLSAQVVLRESGVGTWAVTVDETAQWSPMVQEGWGVIIVDDDGSVLCSGPATHIGVSQEGRTRDVELRGVTDMHVLADRRVYPDPAAGYDQQTVTHYTAKGAAETLILDMVRGQCVPDPAWPTAIRRSAGLVLPVSLGRGPLSSVSARFTNLLAEVQTLATVGGLVVDVVQDGTDLALTIREPTDRSRSVRFLPGAGLADYSMSLTAPETTTVILMGEGDGTARNIVGGSAPLVERWGARRIEAVEDRRDTGDADEYQKTITEALEEGGPVSSASISIEETPNQRFGTHYRLGDTLTAMLPGGVQVTDGLRTADITWTEFSNGRSSTRDVKLTIGEHATDETNAPAWVKGQKELLRRIRHLEVSQ